MDDIMMIFLMTEMRFFYCDDNVCVYKKREFDGCDDLLNFE